MAGREIYIINIQERRKAKKGGGPQIKLLPLKILTAEKTINHYAQKRNDHLLKPFLSLHGRTICAAQLRTVRCHFMFLFLLEIKLP